jgi:hypothetical protein
MASASMPPSPLRVALLAQLGGVLLTGLAMKFIHPGLADHPLAAAFLQGACAAAISQGLQAPRWWLPIHLAFLPLATAALALNIPPWVWLLGFTILLLVFWRTDQSRVPLYLSNAATASALIALLPPHPCRVIDLGCGDGGLLRRLARARPDCTFLGFEHAPLTWLWARLASLGTTNLSVRRGDFWRQNLRDFDVVYAFLSPAPMPRLWSKAQAEQAPGTLLVSNTFAIPDAEPEQIIDVADRRKTRLYCYRLSVKH